MIEVTVESVHVSLVNSNRIVVLRENDSPRYLPIWIGPFEAEAITMGLRHDEVPRPMTHDLLGLVIRSLGASVKHICINELRDETFHAEIVLEQRGRRIEIDSRSSDALALAVRLDVPIYVSDEVMDRVGQVPASDYVTQTAAAPANDDSLELFRDFIDSLDLGEVGGGAGGDVGGDGGDED
jgi:bifunctional DNase/RNase